MILIDSVYINNGGGFTLLKYLVSILESKKLDVFYLFDERVKGKFDFITQDRSLYLKNSMLSRYWFYHQNKQRFSSVLCFGNIPPLVKLNIPVYTYFHQPLFLEVPKDFSLDKKVIYWIKQFILYFYKNNTSFWIVQSNLIQESFSKKYLNGFLEKVKVLPFYPSFSASKENIKRIKNRYIYVSNSSSHKNHERLISAFCNAYNISKTGELVLTIPESDTKLCNIIRELIKKGYPIINLGFIHRDDLLDEYLKSEYLIFPSLTESFGLGLAEAIDCGCKVIGADLDYTYQVCQPSLVFNPLSENSIKEAIIYSMKESLPDSKALIKNNIDSLISLLN